MNWLPLGGNKEDPPTRAYDNANDPAVASELREQRANATSIYPRGIVNVNSVPRRLGSKTVEGHMLRVSIDCVSVLPISSPIEKTQKGLDFSPTVRTVLFNSELS